MHLNKIPKTHDELIESVFKESNIESSSDFIVTLYKIVEKIDSEIFLKIDPIYRWEYSNWHDLWEANVNFIGKKLDDLDQFDYDEIELSYVTVLDFLLMHDVMNKMYRLDNKDHIGWKIFKEIDEKRVLVRKMSNIAKMKREKTND